MISELSEPINVSLAFCCPHFLKFTSLQKMESEVLEKLDSLERDIQVKQAEIKRLQEGKLMI